MSEQENTSIQEIILSLQEEYQNRMLEVAEHFNELLESREEERRRVESLCNYPQCGLVIGEVLENDSEELEETPLSAHEIP
jgi:hypothetical protein